MKKKVLAAIIIAMGLLTACGNQDDVKSPVILDEEPIATATPTPTPEATATPDAEKEFSIILERTEVDGKMQSYLTGEWKDTDVVQRRNMAVMLSNNKASLPQYGISQASIIYEAPVEGRITRLMAIFEDYDDLDHIGPVRSSRDYYVYEAMGYDSIYVNWGLAVPYVADLINSDRVDNVSQALLGIEVGAPEAFDRISRPGKATEYTGYMFIDGYNDAVERLGYDTQYRSDRFTQAFTFANEGCVAEYEGYPEATRIYPGGVGSNKGGYGSANPCFTYNAEDGLYYRTQFGMDHIDEMNGEQLAVSNVVFKICHGEVRDANDYLAFGVHGEGDAYVFTNGKVIKGTWKRASDYAQNVFYNENGEEIVFNQGKTWICNIWDEYAEFIEYQ